MGLNIIIYCQAEGSFKVSPYFFENRTLSEFCILLNKVCRTSELNEVLCDKLKKFASRASPQVINMSYQVKFFKSSTIQSCNLDPKSLSEYPAKHLVWMENHLRTT